MLITIWLVVKLRLRNKNGICILDQNTIGRLRCDKRRACMRLGARQLQAGPAWAPPPHMRRIECALAAPGVTAQAPPALTHRLPFAQG